MSAGRPAAAALAAAGILLGSAGLGFLFYRLMPPAKPASAAVTATEPPAPRADAGPSASVHPIPETLPDVSLPDLKGKPHHLAEWIGEPLVVNFWATWCAPCRREIPLLEALRRENHRNSFEIIGIAIDHRDSVARYVQDMKMSYPILVGERGGLEAAAAFGMEPVLPFTAFADAQGRIVTLKIGELHRDEATFILARLADVQAGRLNLETARAQIGDAIQRLAVSRAAAGSD